MVRQAVGNPYRQLASNDTEMRSSALIRLLASFLNGIQGLKSPTLRLTQTFGGGRDVLLGKYGSRESRAGMIAPLASSCAAWRGFGRIKRSRASKCEE